VYEVMSVCRVRSLSLLGIDDLPVEVEVDVGAGLPGFSIVGLPDTAVQEARERVRVAISNSGYKFPTKKVIVNLSTPLLYYFLSILSLKLSYIWQDIDCPDCGGRRGEAEGTTAA
jgi:hypothetical protein